MHACWHFIKNVTGELLNNFQLKQVSPNGDLGFSRSLIRRTSECPGTTDSALMSVAK